MGRAPVRSAALLLLLAATSCGKVPPVAPAHVPVPAPAPLLPDPPPEPWETEKDPVKARTTKLETEWSLDPLFADVSLRFLDLRPALVAVEVGEDGKAPDAMGERVGQNLRLLAGRIRELLREAGLDAPPLSAMADHRIRVMIFRSRESFDWWHVRKGVAWNQGSYYSQNSQRIMMYGGAMDDAECFQLGTYALRHVYARHFCDADDAEVFRRSGDAPVPVEWEDHRLRSSLAWFDRGLARYFGDFRVASGAVVQGDAKKDLAYFAFMKGVKKTWPLAELLFADAPMVRAEAQVKSGGAGMGDEMEALAWVQGHLLVRYFMEGENGRWRSAFLRVIHDEFSGVSAMPYLLHSFGLVDEKGRALRSGDPKVQGWIAEVEKGYLKYAEELAKAR